MLVVATIALLAAACGSDGDDTQSATTSVPATSSVPESSSVAPTVTEAESASGCEAPTENTTTQASGVVADLPDDESGYIEGVVVDQSGNVFVSLIRTGELLRFAPGSSEPEVVGQIPDYIDDGIGFLGLAVDRDGHIYGAVASDTTAGIWKFDCGSGDATRFAGTEEMVFADGVTVAEDGVIYATDADSGAEGDVGLGAIWRIDTDGVATKWFESTVLGASDAESELPGTNGIVASGGSLYTVNTAQGTVVEIPVMADGAAGEAVVLDVDVFAGDGITADADGNLYVTGVSTNEITRINADGSVERVQAGGDVVLVCPTSPHLGTGSTARTLFIANLVSLCDGTGPDLTAIDLDTAPFGAVDTEPSGVALFVVGDADAPDPSDVFLTDVASGYGVDVELLDDEQTGTPEGRSALEAAELVIITGSVDPAAISPDVAGLTTPLVTFSGALSAELGLATTSGETASGETFIVMNPETADHPLSAGLTGNAEVFSAPVDFVNTGEVGGDAIVIATAPGSPSLPTQYAYDAGTTLADGSQAPARRIAGFTTLESLNAVSGEAASLFFAMLDWLRGV